ncbi:hypothetical protein E2C01_004008 [Portunus trituberculatus]|uniref:Uncharacterized protein n=1 Tax=Portunus trituberculatus TaxID=210409 RepID=A0A5B7CRQ1_PORTR|nr:hypothetical protein [Portunus trituberculatus]
MLSPNPPRRMEGEGGAGYCRGGAAQVWGRCGDGRGGDQVCWHATQVIEGRRVARACVCVVGTREGREVVPYSYCILSVMYPLSLTRRRPDPRVPPHRCTLTQSRRVQGGSRRTGVQGIKRQVKNLLIRGLSVCGAFVTQREVKGWNSSLDGDKLMKRHPMDPSSSLHGRWRDAQVVQVRGWTDSYSQSWVEIE